MQFVPYSMYLLLQAGKRLEHGYAGWLVVLLWTVGVSFELLSLWLIIAGFPKREYFFFRRMNGVGTFHIGRVGPDRARFDEFVAKIQQTAELAKVQKPATNSNNAAGS